MPSLSDTKKWKHSFYAALLVVIPMLLLHIIFSFLPGYSAQWGILPKHMVGIKGIITSPFIHGDWAHLLSNLPILFLLLLLSSFLYPEQHKRAVPFIWIFSGLMVWLFARPNYHIGASGVVYGMHSLLFFSGVFRHDLRSLAVSFTMMLLFGGFSEGFAIQQVGISWESHLSGFLMGMAAAFLFKIHDPDPTPQTTLEEPEEPSLYNYRYQQWLKHQGSQNQENHESHPENHP